VSKLLLVCLTAVELLVDLIAEIGRYGRWWRFFGDTLGFGSDAQALRLARRSPLIGQ